MQHIRDLLSPGRHRHAEALAFLRTLDVSEQVAGDPSAEVKHPTDGQLERVAKKLQAAEDWRTVLPGLARLSLEQDEGVSYSLRIVKDKGAAPVRVVREGEDGGEDTVSIRKVSELDNWCFYLKDLVSKAGTTRYETEALVHLLRLKEGAASYRVFKMGKQPHGRYSGRALKLIREAIDAGRTDEAKVALRKHRRDQRAARKQADTS